MKDSGFLKNESKNGIVSAIIPAAGTGRRMRADKNKLLLNLAGKTVLEHTVSAFEKSAYIDEIIVVASEEDISFIETLLDKPEYEKVKKIVRGGSERQNSVYSGIAAVDERCAYVVVHDGARALVLPDLIDRVVLKCFETRCVTAAVAVRDTLKRGNVDGSVLVTVDRANLYAAQTPQVFEYEVLKRAHEQAIDEGFMGTDDSILVERLGFKVFLVEGRSDNIKITTPEDLELAEAILLRRGEL